MEETNYHRAPQLSVEPAETTVEISTSQQGDAEKNASVSSPAPSTRVGITSTSGKTLLQKMALFRRQDLDQKNNLKGMVLRPLIFLSFPVIFAAGFMYGSILCYFNVLNGTTSLILSAPPYNFSSSMVGLTYVACLIGVSFG